MKYCTNCGNPATDEANFCTVCGKSFRALDQVLVDNSASRETITVPENISEPEGPKTITALDSLENTVKEAIDDLLPPATSASSVEILKTDSIPKESILHKSNEGLSTPTSPENIKDNLDTNDSTKPTLQNADTTNNTPSTNTQTHLEKSNAGCADYAAPLFIGFLILCALLCVGITFAMCTSSNTSTPTQSSSSQSSAKNTSSKSTSSSSKSTANNSNFKTATSKKSNSKQNSYSSDISENSKAVDCTPCHGDDHKTGEENPHGYPTKGTTTKRKDTTKEPEPSEIISDQWPEEGLVTFLPKPEKGTVTVKADNEQRLFVKMKEVTKDDFNNYIDNCIEAGFTLENRTDGIFTAINAEG